MPETSPPWKDTRSSRTAEWGRIATTCASSASISSPRTSPRLNWSQWRSPAGVIFSVELVQAIEPPRHISVKAPWSTKQIVGVS